MNDDINEMIENDEYDESWKISNADLANWAIKKIKEEQAYTERLTTIAKNEISRLNERIMELEARADKRTSFLKGKLREYFEKVSEGKKETKTQISYELLDGKLVYKKPQLKMVPDKVKLLEAIKSTPGYEFLIKTTEEVDWAQFKTMCDIVDGKVISVQTGEVIEEIYVEESEPKFEIK